MKTITILDVIIHNRKLIDEKNELTIKNQELENEVKYLRARNKDLRQKSWFQVYEENLKLQEDIKRHANVVVENVQMKEEIKKAGKVWAENHELRKEITKLQNIIESIETFIGGFKG